MNFFGCFGVMLLCLSPLFLAQPSLLAQPNKKPSSIITSRAAAGGGGAAAWYTDVAPQSDFAYRTNNNFTGRKYFPQPMCGGVALFDFDNDGHLDIFLTNGAKLPELQKTDASFHNALLRNNGDGKFTDVTASAGLAGTDLGYSFGVAAADYNNDGFADLFVANAGHNVLYRNNGDGTFADVTVKSGLNSKPSDLLSVGAAWLDYDRDGLLDLVVSNYTNWTPSTDQRCTRGGTLDVYCNPSTYKSVAQRLYRHTGDNVFEDVTERAGLASALGKGMGISVADFNGDGATDIFIANDTERNFLFINKSDGTFKESGLLYGVAFNDQGATVSAMGCDAKDFNNDGWIDIFYNNLAGQIYAIFQNEGGKFFRYISPDSELENLSRPFSGWSAGFIDYNNDGWKDIYNANGDVDDLGPKARQHDTMFENVQGKSFIDVSAQMGKDFMATGFQRGSAFGDLNNDGFQDLVVTALSEKPRILFNNGKSGNHWLIVDLQGRSSNRDAIGAQLKVTTAATGRTLFNHVTTSVGFMSSSDKRVHFGLGRERAIKELEIRWPSGKTQRIANIAADQILKVKELAK